MSKPHIIIYTDGACKGNPGPGGWGAVLRVGHPDQALAPLGSLVVGGCFGGPRPDLDAAGQRDTGKRAGRLIARLGGDLESER